MGKKTKIGWTDHTQNFWWGCTKVSTECKYCYIAQIMRRAGKQPFRGPMQTRNWDAPFTWNKAAKRDRLIRRVFTCSMSDFFHPGADKWRDEAWQVIRACDQLDWLILTKRPELIPDRLPNDWQNGYPNVWLGVTVGAESSMSRVDCLKRIPAAVRFISAEPLLEPLDFSPHLDGSIHWIISGCERARKGKRRLIDMDWVHHIDHHCRQAGIAHFLKQYYRDDRGLPVEDGRLDGRVCQAWPRSCRPQRRPRVGCFTRGK